MVIGNIPKPLFHQITEPLKPETRSPTFHVSNFLNDGKWNIVCSWFYSSSTAVQGVEASSALGKSHLWPLEICSLKNCPSLGKRGGRVIAMVTGGGNFAILFF